MSIIKEILYRIRGEYTTEKLISMGMKVGKNFGRLHGVILDPSHCWLIEIGDDVTMAPRVHVLCHDASTSRIYKDWKSKDWKQRIRRSRKCDHAKCNIRG